MDLGIEGKYNKTLDRNIFNLVDGKINQELISNN